MSKDGNNQASGLYPGANISHYSMPAEDEKKQSYPPTYTPQYQYASTPPAAMPPAYPSMGSNTVSGTVIHTQPTPTQTIKVVSLGFKPQPVDCPSCGAHNVLSEVKYEPGTFAYLTSAMCCIFGCWLGCCLIPCCVDGFQDAEHSCSRCHRPIGERTRM